MVWLAAAHALLATVLAARLPVDAWFVSDPGARLVAARAVLEHPARPFEVDHPGLPAALAAELPQPYFAAHGDHAHAIAPPLFPILVAPFLALFGVYGLVVLPIASWVAIGPLTVRLAQQLGAEVKPWLVMLASIIATPLVFYGLEFWEHAPAVACLLAGTVTSLSAGGRTLILAGGGALLMCAFQLRPEMAPAILAAALVVSTRRSPRALIPVLCGALATAIPFLGYNLVHFGRATSPHVAINLALLGERWWTERVHDARMWFGSANPISIAGFVLITAGWLMAYRRRMRASGSAVAMAGAALVAFEAALAREPEHSFFRAFPLGLAAVIPFILWNRASRDLAILILIPVIGCWLTAPNDGGGQWGARYLLAAVPAMLVLALQNVTQLARRHRAGIAAAVWLLLAGLVVSRTGYQELRGAKRYYSRLSAVTLANLGDAPHLMTDAWWVPAAHAGAVDHRRTAVIERPSDAARLLAAFSPAAVLAVTDKPHTTFSEWTTGTCYKVDQEQASPDSRLRYARLMCR